MILVISLHRLLLSHHIPCVGQIIWASGAITHPTPVGGHIGHMMLIGHIIGMGIEAEDGTAHRKSKLSEARKYRVLFSEFIMVKPLQ